MQLIPICTNYTQPACLFVFFFAILAGIAIFWILNKFPSKTLNTPASGPGVISLRFPFGKMVFLGLLSGIFYFLVQWALPVFTTTQHSYMAPVVRFENTGKRIHVARFRCPITYWWKDPDSQQELFNCATQEEFQLYQLGVQWNVLTTIASTPSYWGQQILSSHLQKASPQDLKHK